MNIYKINQQDYDTILFLTRLAYYSDVDDIYPEPFDKVVTVEHYSGLRFNVFDMDDYVLVVICGSNSLRDWITNTKVGLGIEPKQYIQAKQHVLHNIYGVYDKPIVFSGHSLGGGIAEYLGTFFEEASISFNGCGMKHLVKGRIVVESINIVTKHDILNGITLHLPFKKYMQHCGQVIEVEDGRWFYSAKSHTDFGAMTKVKL